MYVRNEARRRRMIAETQDGLNQLIATRTEPVAAIRQLLQESPTAARTAGAAPIPSGHGSHRPAWTAKRPTRRRAADRLAQFGRITAHVLGSWGKFLPSITSQDRARADMIEGYCRMAENARTRGDKAVADVYEGCAAALKQELSATLEASL